MFRILDEHVFPFIRALNGEGTSYARHMRDARFQIPGPARDTKGDVYEYMLSKIASAGQNGQFRTPRHIIATMVELVEPKPEDVICDPAVGTCGFLVAAGEYPKIIASRESSTMVSTWTEYLRLSVIGEGSASLEICQYEVLAEADYGEDDEDQPLPEQLEGKKVVGISQDGYVVGGDLVCGDDQFSFTRADIEEALQWLSDENWKVTKEMTDELRSSVNT
jgi:hypothetical protein